MPEFLQNVENGNHLKDSGEHIVTDTYKPKEFLDFAKLIWPVWSVLPKQAQNKDNFRNPDANQITATIIKQIEKKFQNKTKALKKHSQNKLSYWGALFETILDFYTNNIMMGKPTKLINEDDFNKIPKRCRSVFKKQNNLYRVSNSKESGDKISLVFIDAKAEQQFIELSNEARELISVIYNKDVIKSVLPESEKQIYAFNRLQKIFNIIINLCFFVKTKSNANDVISEYKYAKTNENIILKAQRHIRTAHQLVVSAKKNSKIFNDKYISDTEARYKQTKCEVLKLVHNTIHQYFK